MRGPKDLLEAEDNWVTEIGAVFPGERAVVRGKDLFSEFSGNTWQSLLVFIVTGRILKPDEIEILEQVWTLTSNYPDPRIWNNRVAALAGTTSSTAYLAVGASVAVTEAEVYGGGPLLRAVEFIKTAKIAVNNGEDLKNFITNYLHEYRAIGGFGRPVVRKDERIEPFEKVMKKFGVNNGEHVCLAYEIEDLLMNGRWRMQMNIGGLVAALVADLGFSARDFYLWLVAGFSAGALGCFIDSSEHSAGTLFPLSCGRIKYNGSDKRKWD